MKNLVPAFLILSASAKLVFGDSTTNLGIFSEQADIGNVARPGSVNFDPSAGEYLISGGGENMWLTNDAFHFVWVKMSGDLSLAADIKFLGTQGNPHRKACLIIRQSLDSDSAYADVAVHGVGLTALQYRETAGDTTHEIQSDVSGPARVGLEKHGGYLTMSVAAAGEALHPDGAMYRIQFKEPFYVGLGVCAHNNKAIEQTIFSSVELKSIPVGAGNPAVVESALETVEVASTDRQVVYHTRDHIEAPNWSRDGKYFYFNSKGRIYQLPVKGGTPEPLNTGGQTQCNNDHGISPDGQRLAISDQSGDGKSHVYVLPISGGKPRLITKLAPSYWHGWSPDGKTLAYCAERKGEFDIYTIPAKGGKEKRLTTAPGLDDGPDYSPDGKYIYFNSERTGLMQIWRMKPDGSDQEQVTTDDYNNWFAHPSPNGRWIVFLSYAREVKGHPPGQDVMIRLMSLANGKIQVLAKLYGGQGTINVPSWSPDSRNLAFVSYQMIHP
ncbi:MAG TPA: TolB family protein [Verrucomicrobiae bacterium]|nr:TolB family protein [Verrucomicrobiae bacterium]